MDIHVEWVGYAAGTLTAVAYVPQVWKVWSTRSAQDISLKMILVLSVGLALWCVYGIAVAQLPIIIANGISVILTLAVALAKLRFG
jgi:MtN3 and saliva related transmembrane protein